MIQPQEAYVVAAYILEFRPGLIAGAARAAVDVRLTGGYGVRAFNYAEERAGFLFDAPYGQITLLGNGGSLVVDIAFASVLAVKRNGHFRRKLHLAVIEINQSARTVGNHYIALFAGIRASEIFHNGNAGYIKAGIVIFNFIRLHADLKPVFFKDIIHGNHKQMAVIRNEAGHIVIFLHFLGSNARFSKIILHIAQQQPVLPD